MFNRTQASPPGRGAAYAYLTGRAAVFAVLSALILSGCATRPALIPQYGASQLVRGERFDLRLTFIEETQLIERYGRRDNLFIAPSGTLMNERFIPFDLEVTGRSETITIALNQIEISYGGRSVSPTNQFHFGLYWQNQDESGDQTGSDINARQRTIRQTLLGNQFRVAPTETTRGMLLFRGNFPQFGTAVITVAILDQTNRPVERAQFTFEF